MLYLIVVFGYVILAMTIGLLGMNRKFGFWGYFFGSLLFTPALGALLVIASDKSRWKRVR